MRQFSFLWPFMYCYIPLCITPHWKNWLLRVYLVFREYLFFVNGTNVSFTVNDEVQFYADEKQCRRPSMDLQMQNFFLPNFAYLKIHKHSHYKHFFMHNISLFSDSWFSDLLNLLKVKENLIMSVTYVCKTFARVYNGGVTCRSENSSV